MSGTKSRLTPIEVRKQLLLAESDVNRVQLLHEWQSLERGARELARHTQSICSAVTSIVSMGIAGFNAFRDLHATRRRHGKTAWFSTLINGVRLGTSLWTSFRSQL